MAYSVESDQVAGSTVFANSFIIILVIFTYSHVNDWLVSKFGKVQLSFQGLCNNIVSKWSRACSDNLIRSALFVVVMQLKYLRKMQRKMWCS